MKNSFLIKPNRGRNANKLISNNIKNSINNGTRIYLKPNKKMLKL